MRGTSTEELAGQRAAASPVRMRRSRMARPQRFLVIRPLGGLSRRQKPARGSLTTLTECLTPHQKVPHE